MIKNQILLEGENQHLSGYQWSAENAMATVLLIHGLGEHIERYQHVAEKFIDQNLNVVGVDLPGHGESSGKRGHIKSISQFFDTIDLLINYLDKKEIDLPIIIYGHSMGGTIVLSYLLARDQRRFAAAIATSPWLRLALVPGTFQLLLAKTMNNLLPGLQQPNGLNIENISSVIDEQEKYRTDPLNHDKVSVRLFNEIYRAGLVVIEQAENIKIPVLIAHGEADGITSKFGSEEFAERCPQATLKLWPGLRHETHNEYNKDEVIRYYINWLVNKLD